MSLALKRFENGIRPTYEAIAAVGWSVSCLVMTIVLTLTNLPKAAFVVMAGLSGVMALWRWRAALAMWSFKLALTWQAFVFMRADILTKRIMPTHPDMLWLGAGFKWKPIHTQRIVEIRKMDEDELYPPKWFTKLKIGDAARSVVGKAWIHGVGCDKPEQHLWVPLKALEGHTLVFGTTGAGKTRLFDLLITQAIARNEAVIIIDPKGDSDLRECARQACINSGRPNAFLMFHPAYPSESIRIDPLKNWNNSTEIASRIAALMPSESGSDSFTQMAWKAVHVVSEGLIFIEKMPTLMRLRRFIEGGPERLMEEVLRTYFERNVDHWQSLVAPIVQRARDGKLPLRMNGTAELLGYVYFYKSEVPEDRRDASVDGLLAMVEHNREHLGKILSSLVPLLVQLTAGELGKMLSPDPDDLDDPRPIFDSKKIIKGGHVLYLGLDSLSNATVGAALGSIQLADLTAVAGERYNYENGGEGKVQLFVDESAEVVNVPLIQLLNKGRGASMVATLAAQTLPDFIARMGNESRARQILGNCNNLIALRTKDGQTQEFVAETFSTTYVQSIQRSIASGQKTDDAGLDYNNNAGQRMSEVEVDIFPAAMLGWLPDLHFVASVAGGTLIKGRLPKITVD